MDISIDKHHSKYIFVVGHYDCADNPEKKKYNYTKLKNLLSLLKLGRMRLRTSLVCRLDATGK